MNCNLPASSVHGISQARILEWVSIPSSRVSSWRRDRTCISCIGSLILYHWATRETQWKAIIGLKNNILETLRHTEKAMAPHSSTLAWKIPWMEEPSRLKSMGSFRVGQDWATSLSVFTFMHWRRKWHPLQYSCLENPRDREASGLLSMGSHRVGHDWSDLASTWYVDQYVGEQML